MKYRTKRIQMTFERSIDGEWSKCQIAPTNRSRDQNMLYVSNLVLPTLTETGTIVHITTNLVYVWPNAFDAVVQILFDIEPASNANVKGRCS